MFESIKELVADLLQNHLWELCICFSVLSAILWTVFLKKVCKVKFWRALLIAVFVSALALLYPTIIFLRDLPWLTIWNRMDGFLWEISLILSASLFVLATILLYNRWNLKFWYTLLFSAAFSVLTIFYPFVRVDFGSWGTDPLQNFLQFFEILFQAGFKTAGVLALKWGYLYDTVKAIPLHVSGGLSYIYIVYVHTLFLGTAIIVLGSSISFLKNLTPTRKPRESGLKNVYAFSELNEKSLALAKDCKSREKNKKAVIVFAGIKEQTSTELLQKAHEMHAVCLKNDITVINFKNMMFFRLRNLCHKAEENIKGFFDESFPKQKEEKKNVKEEKPKKEKPKKEKIPKNYLKFFLIGENEDQNLIQSLTLINRYKERRKTEVYVFSKKVESGLVLSSVDVNPDFIKVRKINETRSLVNYLLLNKGVRLFETAKEDNGIRKISAVIVGLGRHGTEMLKALAWYGQMDGYSIEIHAFDKDEYAEEKFAVAAPGLMQESNGDQDAQYKIRIYSNIDVDKKRFVDEIKRLSNVTYVFVARGNDEDNIRTAVALRSYFAHPNATSYPIIHSVVYNSELKAALQDEKEDGTSVCKLTTFDGRSYDIEFVGDIATTYTEAVIEPEQIEKEALKVHLEYGSKPLFWKYEYCYNSSISTAIHRRAIDACKLPGSDKPKDQRSPEEKKFFDALEHRRWLAYMAGEGYTYHKTKNYLAKTHPEMKNYEDLDVEMKDRIVS